MVSWPTIYSHKLTESYSLQTLTCGLVGHRHRAVGQRRRRDRQLPSLLCVRLPPILTSRSSSLSVAAESLAASAAEACFHPSPDLCNVNIIQMMHGSEWTLKYDEPKVENIARGHSPSATFSTEVIIFQCRTNDHASDVLSYGQPLA